MANYRSIPKRALPEPASPATRSRSVQPPAETMFVPAVIQESGLLHSYALVLARHRGKLIAIALLGAALGLLSSLPRAPKYRAHASLDIQSLNENFMNLRAVDPSGASGAYSAESNLQTSIKLVQSEELLSHVVRSMELESNVDVPRHDLLSVLGAKLGLWRPRATPRAELIEQAAQTIKVSPIGLTRLIDLQCESTDPKIAADFCNTLAHAYIDQDFANRVETAQQTNAWLTRQLNDVRNQLEQKETQLLAYARDNKILFNEETDSVNQEKLKQDQLELSRAQADRIAKESQATLVNSSNPDSLPPVLDSGPLKGYQEKMTDLLRQKADLTATLTPNHPKVLHIQAQIDALQASIDKERTNILGRIHNEFTAAQVRESLLQGGYQQQEKTVANEVAKEGQFNLLRHEVDSERQTYESLMQHVREAGLLSMMRSSAIRIVDTARVPKNPFAPSRIQSGAIGLLLGSIFGVSLIFWRERSIPMVRVPGDAPSLTHMRELGVIPSSHVDTRFPGRSNLALVTLESHRSLLAESYRSTMNSVLLRAQTGRGGTAIVISSPGAGEGKTTLTANLGIAIAETGRRIIIVDGDLRRPRLHQIFKVSNDFGISDILAGGADMGSLPIEKIAQPTQVPGLSVVACGSKGSSNISTMLHAEALDLLLRRLRNECDVVLIDTPPLLHMSDGRVIARFADGAILVYRSGVTAREAAKSVRDMLEHDGSRILGTVLNDFNPSQQGFYSYYKSHYAYQG